MLDNAAPTIIKTEPIVDLEAEQALLGALLTSSASYGTLNGLMPEHFGNPVHSRTFSAIGKLIAAGAKPDPVTIRNVLGEEPVLVPLGGTSAFILRLIGAAGTATNVPFYAKAIIETAGRRALADVAREMAIAVADPAASAAGINERIDGDLRRLREQFAPHDTLTSASDLAGKPLPERQAIVPEWIFAHQVALLSGDGGMGKSLIAMQLQIAAASAQRWMGLPVVPCRSAGWYAEDDNDELHIRLVQLAELMRVNIATLDRMSFRSTVGEDNELAEPDDRGTVRPTAAFHRIEQAAVRFGARLIVLDAATNFFGADEINRRQVNSFLRLLRQLAVKINGSVLLLAHPSLAGLNTGSGISGSTHWHNGVRSRLYFTRPADEDSNPDERVLTKIKANYSSSGDAVRLLWQAGGFVAPDAPAGTDLSALHAKADRVFRNLLAVTYSEGTWTSPNPQARNYAPTIFAQRPDREGLGKRVFADAMHRLTAARCIATEPYGRPSHQNHRLCMT